MANIRLNVLPVLENDFEFTIYRKLKEDEEKEDGIYNYQLPNASELEDRAMYLVSLNPKQGFEEFTAHSKHAIGLTKHYLYWLFINALNSHEECPLEFRSVEKNFNDEKVEFTLHEFTEGKQIIYLSPFFHEEQRSFGFLIDFKFSRNKEHAFNKNVQIHSLSLDSHGRSNKNYYSDKFRFIQHFLHKVYDCFKDLKRDGREDLHISNELIETPVFNLNKKEYVFQNKNTSSSQFQGIRNFGPFQKIEQEVIFVFIFEERLRSFANELYLSLTGKSNPGTFPGFQQMFGVPISTNNVEKINIDGYSDEQLSSIIERINEFRENDNSKKVVGIYIEDYPIDQEDIEGSNRYFLMKYHFIKNSIPLQVVNYRKLGERNSLKWSTSNLALAIFSKMGGIPWVVKPSNNNCLILGIGSAHKKSESGEITKYFAYTICLDSSGLYKTLQVLADESSENTYLEKLKTNLVALLKNGNMGDYKTCVLHIPFKIKHKEIEAISEAIKEITDIDFVAIKVNLNNKYFGYSFHNTLVPYESSFVKLSRNEYLVWFEGLLYGKEVVDKRLSNPVHIQFLNLNNQREFDEKKYLQDVLNLSGANWRGFNAKSSPISIYYSQIIAKYSEAFENIDGYDENSISNNQPWFL
jgi:hypothetical protein